MELFDLPGQLRSAPAVLVTVARVEGSGPREVGAWMAVTAGELAGSIGGGQLEHELIAESRRLLAAGRFAAHDRRYALGPSLGQCCGGVVHLRLEWLDASDADGLRERLAAPPLLDLALFGGGHVGRAIIELVARLPVRVQWFDSRDEIFPTALPAHVQAEHSDPIQAAVAEVRPSAKVLIMSFSHAEDLDIVAACLTRQRERSDLPFIGLIGSQSKWASFRHRLEVRGFDEVEMGHITCPIGIPRIHGKQPEVIALAAVAQLLQK
ncbi:MAG: xanthine dehydrogenase accessory protein XdhC [Paucibacter sp.]|nr:xanthine dehydrogenase accessory protein XdhC [Roseateles sp.]